MKYFWNNNLWRWLFNKKLGFTDSDSRRMEEPKYPSNICTLFWGSVWAFISSAFCLFAAGGLSAVVVVVFVVFAIMCIFISFFGFLPVFSKEHYREKEAKEKGEDKLFFHRYKRCGNKDEKKYYIAPWEVVTAGLIIWLLGVKNFFIPRQIGMFFQLPLFWIIAASIVLVVGLILFFRSTPGKVFVEFLKAKKRKACHLIIIEKKE